MACSNIITIEGINGCGKSTVISRLLVALASQGIEASGPFADPGTTEVGNALRAILKGGTIPLQPVEQLFLYTTSRITLARYLRERTDLDTAAGRSQCLYLLDRWVYSTYAYQGAGGISADEVADLHRYVRRLVPHVHGIYLRIPPELSMARTKAASPAQDVAVDRFEAMGCVFLSKACEKYDEMAEAGDLHAIDATRPVDEVVAEVLDYITTLDRRPAWSA